MAAYLDRFKSTDIDSFVARSEPDHPPICSDVAKREVGRFLARLMNNNDDDYFYLERVPECDFPEQGCVDVACSMALPSEAAYDGCAKAKLLELNEEFRPKLGWLIGRMYARVGTQDWPEAELNERINQMLSRTAVWLPEKQFGRLKRMIKTGKVESGPIETVLLKVPSRKEEVIAEVIKHVREEFPDERLSNGELAKLRKLLEANTIVKQALKD